ncbi:MAG: hypothetical protein ACYDD2_09755 [Candidatus Acidiferrales bacterium]
MTKPFHAHSAQVLRLAGAGLEGLKFPSLIRPDISFDSAPTKELINWVVQLYSFSLLSQLRAVLGGVISLVETRNIPALRMLVRALFEMGAHSCYVKKHVKQCLEANHLEEAWEFLLPLGTSTLYTISPYSEDSPLFPSPAHIDKVINCFNEIMEGDALESYSLLSEYCHVDMAVFKQHYDWEGSRVVTFDVPERDMSKVLPLGASATLAALDAVSELLELANETEIRTKVTRLLARIVSSG